MGTNIQKSPNISPGYLQEGPEQWQNPKQGLYMNREQPNQSYNNIAGLKNYPTNHPNSHGDPHLRLQEGQRQWQNLSHDSNKDHRNQSHNNIAGMMKQTPSKFHYKSHLTDDPNYLKNPHFHSPNVVHQSRWQTEIHPHTVYKHTETLHKNEGGHKDHPHHKYHSEWREEPGQNNNLFTPEPGPLHELPRGYSELFGQYHMAAPHPSDNNGLHSVLHRGSEYKHQGRHVSFLQTPGVNSKESREAVGGQEEQSQQVQQQEQEEVPEVVSLAAAPVTRLSRPEVQPAPKRHLSPPEPQAVTGVSSLGPSATSDDLAAIKKEPGYQAEDVILQGIASLGDTVTDTGFPQPHIESRDRRHMSRGTAEMFQDMIVPVVDSHRYEAYEVPHQELPPHDFRDPENYTLPPEDPNPAQDHHNALTQAPHHIHTPRGPIEHPKPWPGVPPYQPKPGEKRRTVAPWEGPVYETVGLGHPLNSSQGFTLDKEPIVIHEIPDSQIGPMTNMAMKMEDILHESAYDNVHKAMVEPEEPLDKENQPDDYGSDAKSPASYAYFLHCHKCNLNYTNENPPLLLDCAHLYCLRCVRSMIGETPIGGYYRCDCGEYIQVMPQKEEFYVKPTFITRLEHYVKNLAGIKEAKCCNGAHHDPATFKCTHCNAKFCQECDIEHREVVLHAPKLLSEVNEAKAMKKLPEFELACPRHPKHAMIWFCLDDNCRKIACNKCLEEFHLPWSHTVMRTADFAIGARESLNFFLESVFQITGKAVDNSEAVMRWNMLRQQQMKDTVDRLITYKTDIAKRMTDQIMMEQIEKVDEIKEELLRENRHYIQCYLYLCRQLIHAHVKAIKIRNLANNVDYLSLAPIISSHIAGYSEACHLPLSYVRIIEYQKVNDKDPKSRLGLKIKKTMLTSEVKAMPFPIEHCATNGIVWLGVNHSCAGYGRTTTSLFCDNQKIATYYMRMLHDLAPRCHDLAFVNYEDKQQLAVINRHEKSEIIDSNDNQFVPVVGEPLGHPRDHYIVVIDNNDQFEKIKLPGFSPTAVCPLPKPGLLYADCNFPRIKPSIMHWKGPGCEDDIFNPDGSNPIRRACYMCTNSLGQILVSDPSLNKLVLFNEDGYIDAMIFYDRQVDNMAPYGVCADENNFFYAAFPAKNAIASYDTNLKFLGFILNKKDGLKNPMCLTITDDCKLIAGTIWGTVQAFEMKR